MHKYNVYRIEKDKEADLLRKFAGVGLVRQGSQEAAGFTMTLFVSEQPEARVPRWCSQYEGFLPAAHGIADKAHYGVFLASNDAACYAVSLGKSHFYLRDYCDSDFGVELGLRIADKGEFKRKSSQFFGGKRTKGIVLYGDGSGIDFDSAESIDYFKAKPVDQATWGKSVGFGSSVLLSVKTAPVDLPYLLAEMENQLRLPPSISIPRATKVAAKERIAELDHALVQAILAGDEAQVNAGDLALSGVEFIFRDNCRFTLKHGRQRSECLGHLTLESLREFLGEFNIDLTQSLDKINVQVEEDGKAGYTKPLRWFLEYVSEPYFLKEGKWYEFNQDYIRHVEREVDGIELEDGREQNYSEAARKAWARAQPDGTITYAEYYYNTMRAAEGYELMDRVAIETLRNKYSVEKLDLLKDGGFYYVKIGEPPELGYAVDQSMVMLRLLAENPDGIELGGEVVKPKKIVLWFVLERGNEIERLSEIKSLILHMKVCEWRRMCRNLGIAHAIRVSYKRP